MRNNSTVMRKAIFGRKHLEPPTVPYGQNAKLAQEEYSTQKIAGDDITSASLFHMPSNDLCRNLALYA